MHGELPKRLLQTTRRNRRMVMIVGGAILLVLIAVVYYAFSGSSTQRTGARGRFGGEGPVPVLVAAATRADVPIYLDAVGTTKALNSVIVKPQVDGKLISIAFKEGDDVKKGDVLARIDPTTYQAQLDQAIGKKAQDEAQLANARLDLERYERLAASASINKQQADTQRALVAQYEALVKSDQGAIDNARAILEYTTVRAPLDGRTGLRQVDEGNIVHASDTAGLVTITQLKPISVTFNLPQQHLAQINAAFEKGPLAVDALRSDNDAVIDRGSLQVIDNQVDPTTGTVKLKADFPNATLALWPGQFVNVRALVDTLRQVVVIPTGAVQRGPNGTFVYVVKADNTAEMRPVTVSQQDETQAVIPAGLEPPERVVTTGFARLTTGSAVRISEGGATPAPTTGARPRGEGQRRRTNTGAPTTAPGTAPAAPSAPAPAPAQ